MLKRKSESYKSLNINSVCFHYYRHPEDFLVLYIAGLLLKLMIMQKKFRILGHLPDIVQSSDDPNQPWNRKYLGTSSSTLASSTHIFNLIILENPNRACLISSKFCKWLKTQIQLKHLPFSSLSSYSIVCYMFFYYRAFLLNPLRRDYALGVVMSCRYHLNAIPIVFCRK